MKFNNLKKLFNDEVEVRNTVELLKKQFYSGNNSEKIRNSLKYYNEKYNYIKKQIIAAEKYCAVNLEELNNEFVCHGAKIICTQNGLSSNYKFLGIDVSNKKYTANVIYKGRYKIELGEFYYGGNKQKIFSNSPDVEINILQPLRKLSKNKDKFSKHIQNICFDLIKSKYFPNDYNL